MQRNKIPCVVTIAGTDPSGGAGIQADIKAISATGSYAASVITALVSQNTVRVDAIEEISPAFVGKQMNSVFSDLSISAVKIGMLSKREIVDVIATFLHQTEVKHIVFDPVMVAKNGTSLIEADMVGYLKTRMFPLCTLITPNIPEAEALLGQSIKTEEEMLNAAQVLGKHYQFNVLVKGGHFEKRESSDVLYIYETQQHEWFHAPRINTKNTHGTGCTFSSAIASYLAQEYALTEAIKKAKHYLTNAIRSGSLQHIGQGFGPVDHFYFLHSL